MGCGEWEGFVQEDSRGAARDGVAVGSEAGGHGGCESEEYRHQFFHLTAAVRGVQLLKIIGMMIGHSIFRVVCITLYLLRENCSAFHFLDLRLLVKGSSQ